MSKPDFENVLTDFKNIRALIDQLQRAFIAHMKALANAIDKVEEAAKIVEEGKK